MEIRRKFFVTAPTTLQLHRPATAPSGGENQPTNRWDDAILLVIIIIIVILLGVVSLRARTYECPGARVSLHSASARDEVKLVVFVVVVFLPVVFTMLWMCGGEKGRTEGRRERGREGGRA